MRAKIGANIANAIVIILIAGLGVYAQFESNNSDNKTEEYESRITQLVKQSDSLINVIQKDSCR